MNQWKQIGPEWRTAEIFQIREMFREEKIPFKMPFSDVFFANYFHMPAKDKRWGILVRQKDWERAVCLLEREGLADHQMLKNPEDGKRGASSEERSQVFHPAVSSR